jgi:hypothetical protein
MPDLIEPAEIVDRGEREEQRPLGRVFNAVSVHTIRQVPDVNAAAPQQFDKVGVDVVEVLYVAPARQVQLEHHDPANPQQPRQGLCWLQDVIDCQERADQVEALASRLRIIKREGPVEHRAGEVVATDFPLRPASITARYPRHPPVVQ